MTIDTDKETPTGHFLYVQRVDAIRRRHANVAGPAKTRTHRRAGGVARDGVPSIRGALGQAGGRRADADTYTSSIGAAVALTAGAQIQVPPDPGGAREAVEDR